MRFSLLAAFALAAPALAATEPLWTVDGALGFGGRDVGGWVVSADADALLSVNRWLSFGASAGAFDSPLTQVFVDCTVPCPSPDGFYALHGGPTVRLTFPWGRAYPYLQMSPQYDVDLTHYPGGSWGPARFAGLSHFAVDTAAGADVAVRRHWAIGGRVWLASGPGVLAAGVSVVLAWRSL